MEQVDFGRRIAQARADAEITQAELAKATGLDRTAIAKVESGSRRITASELVAVAAALELPIDWFVTDSPPAVVSRRTDPAIGRSRRLDLTVERLARDVDFLVEQKVLHGSRPRPIHLSLPSDMAGAEALARYARVLMSTPDGPLWDLQRAVERLGLLAFSLDLGEASGDAAYVAVDDLGVALVNGCLDPGRRRFNLAHELGHHLLGDAYAPEVAINAGDETERLINAFAVNLLLPRPEVITHWRGVIESLGTRLSAVSVSFAFRTSWTATCNQLRTVGLIDCTARDDLARRPPTAADAIALGERWVAELEAPSVPPEYGRRVMNAYEHGKLTADRTAELLWGTVTLTDLPEQRAVPLESFRRDLEPMT